MHAIPGTPRAGSIGVICCIVASDNRERRKLRSNSHLACLHFHHRRIASTSNDDFFSLVVASVSGQSKSPGVFTCFDLRAAAPPLRHTPLLLSHHHDRLSHTRITLIMVGAPSAAASLVGFLSEPDTALQVFALEELNNDMDNIWTEVSGSIGQMCAPSRDIYDKHS